MRRSRIRRRRMEAEEMNITAFMNLMVILVPFLLITAVFSRVAILELNLPASASGNPPPTQTVSIEVTIRRDALEVGSREQGVIRRIARRTDGAEFRELSDIMQSIKSRFPDKLDATVLAESDTAYDTLVQVMDSVRTAEIGAGKARTHVELFPEISVGDAPAGSHS